MCTGKTRQSGSSFSKRTFPGRVFCQFIVKGYCTSRRLLHTPRLSSSGTLLRRPTGASQTFAARDSMRKCRPGGRPLALELNGHVPGPTLREPTRETQQEDRNRLAAHRKRGNIPIRSWQRDERE